MRACVCFWLSSVRFSLWRSLIQAHLRDISEWPCLQILFVRITEKSIDIMFEIGGAKL